MQWEQTDFAIAGNYIKGIHPVTIRCRLLTGVVYEELESE
jgi:hypothetical protein